MRQAQWAMLVCGVWLPAPVISLAGQLSEIAPPGSHISLDAGAHQNAPGFRTGQPIVATTYFYWYDVYTGAHIRHRDGADAMTTHPPEDVMRDLSWKSVASHDAQLQDMSEAGIDVLLPVYWGVPGVYDSWCFEGLPPLVEAHDRMRARHTRDKTSPMPPLIGLFYDTSTLSHNLHPDGSRNRKVDLTTPYGREWFYVTIRDFFSMIPPEKWARIDDKPIIFLYAGSFAAGIDAKLYDDARARFKSDFGTDFFLVRHADWPSGADAWYQWGGALGLTIGRHVAGLGPGYDHSAVPGRKPLVVERRGGEFYREQWEQLLRMNPSRRPWIVHVETWNEWHEGTDIARSAEWGNLYMALTRRYADMFRAGTRIESSGPFADADRVRWAGRITGGLELRESRGDGIWEWVDENREAVVTKADTPGRYLYFNVHDSYMYDETDRVAEVVVLFKDDGGCDRFRVEYDNEDPAAGPREGAFRPLDWIRVGDSGEMRMVTVHLPNARFCNRCNDADFRIAVMGAPGELTVAEIIVRRLPGRVMTLPAN